VRLTVRPALAIRLVLASWLRRRSAASAGMGTA